jgi:TP901 family phage tail tape measure protein
MPVSNVELRVDSRQAVTALQQVNRASGQLDNAIGQLQRALGGLTASFAGGFAISKIIQDFAELDKNIRRLGTAGGDVKALDEGLGNLSTRLDGVASKAELAAASYQALSAGFSDTEGNIKLVEAATKAAVGGLADTTQVTEVLTKTLNAYNMSGSQAIKVTDSISKAIEYGQVEWSDYTSQLGRVASIAALAGVSLDEVNAFIAAATKNGATAEVAFTGLSAALTQILQPTKESQDAAKLLGIQWNLAGIQGKGFTGLMAELAKAQNINKEAAARLVGSQEGMRGVFAANAKAGKDYQMILQGLQEAAGKTDSDFSKMKESLENQLKALDTAFKNLSNEVAATFAPVVGAALKTVIDKLNEAATIMRDFRVGVEVLAGAFGGLASAIASLDGPLLRSIARFNELGRNAGFRLMAGIFTAGSTELLLGVAGFGAAKRKRDAKNQPIGPEMPDRLRNAAVARAPINIIGGGAGGGDGSSGAANAAERAAKAAADEQARVAEVIRSRLAEGQITRLNSELKDKIAAAEASGDKMLAARLQGQQKELDIQYRYAQELAKETNARAQEAIISAGLTELKANQRDVEREMSTIDQQRVKDGAQLLIDKQNELNLLNQIDPLKRDLLQIEQYLNSEEIQRLQLTQDQLDKLRKILTTTAQIKNASSGLKDLYTDIGMSLKSGIVDAIQGAIDGTKSLGDVASQVLRNIANKLLDVAINMALFGEMSGTGTGGGLLGAFFKKRATGGSVTGNRPYLVGERGPELFMPGRSGGIAPSGTFGGGVNIVVNVDATGSSVQGDDQRAKQLGQVVAVAVRQEIIKQKRPGGLL